MTDPVVWKVAELYRVGLRKFATLRRCGVRHMLAIRAHCLFLGALRMVYKFDRWHSTNPYCARPYKKTLVDLVNSLAPSTVVDVGCGLGDILWRVRAEERYGIDPDLGAIRAAPVLHPGKIRWIHGDSSVINSTLSGIKIDCLIMVGWIHGISPEQLSSILLPLLTRVKYCILDAFNSDLAPYPYKHDFGFLTNLATCVSVVNPVNDDIRRLLVYKII